jgi:hypothetical protein
VLTFFDGEYQQRVNVTILNDDLFEAPDEQFKLVLQNASNGAQVSASGSTTVVTIVDDGDKAVLISRASVVANEGGTVDTYDIKLNARPSHAVTVHISGAIGVGGELRLEDGSWTGGGTRMLNGNSYSTIVFEPAAYNLSRQIIVSTVDDLVSEPQEWHPIVHSALSTDPHYNDVIVGGLQRVRTNLSWVLPVDSSKHPGVVYAVNIFQADVSGLLDGVSPWGVQVSEVW